MAPVTPHIFAGSKAQPPGYRFHSDKYDAFHLIHVLRGALFITIEGRARRIGPGGAVLLRQGSCFALHTEERAYSGVCFFVIGEDDQAFHGDAEALMPASAEMNVLAGLMWREVDHPSARSDRILNSLGRALAWSAIRASEEAAAPIDAEERARYWAERVRQALDATIYDGRSAREALSLLSLSQRQLARHFQAVYGISPKQHQVAARIGEADRLLTCTRLSITAIAHRLGYSSAQHFATQHLRHTGKTPSQRRAEAAG